MIPNQRVVETPRNTIVRCEGTTTFSSIYGNLTSFASEFFQSKFPKGFFKKVLISESLTSLHISKQELANYSTPLMVIKPELSLDSMYMENLPRWYTDTHYVSKRRKEYSPVLNDEDREIYLYHVPTRMKVNFAVRIKVPTAMFMYNTMHAIQNKFDINGYEYINHVKLQSEIPKVMIINLALSLGYDLKKQEDRVNFNDYLHQNTFAGIEEQVNLSTGNNMYAYNFLSNILVNYPEVVSGDKNTKNLVVKNGLIAFNFSMETWIPNKFFLELPNNRIELNQDFEVAPENDRFKFNIVLNTDYILPKIGNKHLILKKSFLPDVNVEYDTLNYTTVMIPEVDKVVQDLIRKRLFNTDIFEIKVMYGNQILHDEEYQVDYKNHLIKTYKPMSNHTYTILMYGNLDTLNKINDAILKNEDYQIVPNL